jgi:predicted enzyme related to lactoylglutathione lyase
VLFTPEGPRKPHRHVLQRLIHLRRRAGDLSPAASRGVEFVSEPEKQPWGEFAVFKDPDGNQFVLSSP